MRAKSCPLHLVNVWAAEARFVVAQRIAPGRNEVQGVLDALALLDLEDCIVTADALHCRKDVAAAIRESGGDYALAVKANQPLLLAEVERLLAAGPGERSVGDVEDRHDRAEIRRATIVSAPDLERTHGFPGARAVASVEAVRQTAGGAETISTRLFILSAPLSADRLASVVRAHWSIENNLHWVLDVAFNEDAARIEAETVRKTSPSCASSPSTSSRPTTTRVLSKAKSNAPDGTRLSSVSSLLICDSPALIPGPLVAKKDVVKFSMPSDLTGPIDHICFGRGGDMLDLKALRDAARAIASKLNVANHSVRADRLVFPEV